MACKKLYFAFKNYLLRREMEKENEKYYIIFLFELYMFYDNYCSW